MLNVEPLLAWIGCEQIAHDQVTGTQARRMAALLDRTDVAPEAGSTLPAHWYPMLFGETAAQSRLGADGHPQLGEFLPPVPLPRRMFAGRRVQFGRDLIVGERVTKRSRIHAITPKQGRSGQMCFVTVRHEILGQDGQVFLTEEQDIVYREALAAEAAASPVQAAPAPVDGRVVTPDETMLFRYSAITFNAHRIHYDRPYAQQVEGYPGLVVNGGLTLLLLWEHARAHGVPLRHSASRSLRPLYAGRPLTVSLAAGDGGATAIRAHDDQGVLAAEAVLQGETA